MKVLFAALLITSTIVMPAYALDNPPPHELSIRDQIRADRARDDADNKTSGVARPWDRDADGRRPWDKKGPVQQNEFPK